MPYHAARGVGGGISIHHTKKGIQRGGGIPPSRRMLRLLSSRLDGLQPHGPQELRGPLLGLNHFGVEQRLLIRHCWDCTATACESAMLLLYGSYCFPASSEWCSITNQVRHAGQTTETNANECTGGGADRGGRGSSSAVGRQAGPPLGAIPESQRHHRAAVHQLLRHLTTTTPSEGKNITIDPSAGQQKRRIPLPTVQQTGTIMRRGSMAATT